jgi:hypothetical protein
MIQACTITTTKQAGIEPNIVMAPVAPAVGSIMLCTAVGATLSTDERIFLNEEYCHVEFLRTPWDVDDVGTWTQGPRTT